MILEARESGVNPSGNSSNPSNWDFGSSFFFAGTVVTTIGKLNVNIYLIMYHPSTGNLLLSWKGMFMTVRINVDIVLPLKAMEISHPPHTQGRFSVCFMPCVGFHLT